MTHPQSSGSISGVYTTDSDSPAGGKTGEEAGAAGRKDEEERRAVLRGKKVERVLGDKYDSSPLPLFLFSPSVSFNSMHTYIYN